MFKVKSEGQLRNLVHKMKEDISIEAIEKMRWELLEEQAYYTNVGDELKYDDTTGTIFSDSWAPAIINQGRMPGSFVPNDLLIEWVRKYKEPGISYEKAKAIARKVNFKIYHEGTKPTWFVDDALFDMEQEHS